MSPRVLHNFAMGTLGGIVLLGLLSVSVYQEIQKTRGILQEELRTTAPALSRALAERDWARVAEIGRSFSQTNLQALGIRQDGGTVFSSPSEDSLGHCTADFQHDIKLYGVQVGKLSACISFARSAATILHSATFLALVLVVPEFDPIFIHYRPSASSYR